ncbi:MAG: hypothetical protein ACE15F_13790 [bacterium]
MKILKYSPLFAFLCGFCFAPSPAFSFYYYIVDGNPVRWDGSVIPMSAGHNSFLPDSAYRSALDLFIMDFNANNPSNCQVLLSFDDTSISIGNGENEVCFITNQDVLGGAPAVTKWRRYGSSLAEADIFFDANVAWTPFEDKSGINSYGGAYRPFQTTFLHELGHAFGLAHNAIWYNIMGTDWTHIHPENTKAVAYLGPDASGGLMFLYGARSQYKEDLSVVHWRWVGSSGEYSVHDRCRVFNANGVELSRDWSTYEPTYYVNNAQAIQVEFSYENNGRTNQTVQGQFYLSDDWAISKSDRLLATYNFNLNVFYAPWTVALPVSLPNDLYPNRNYYIGCIIDSGEWVSESFRENNNTTYTGLKTSNFPSPTPTRTPTRTPTMTPTRTHTPGPSPTPTPTPLPTIDPHIRLKHVFVLDYDIVTRPDILSKLTEFDMAGFTKYDAAGQRNLTIAWDMDQGGATDWHVYVRRGIGGMKYLGRCGSGAASFLKWAAGAPNLARDFAQGPDFNSVYNFRVIRIDGQLGPDDYFDLAAPVGYNMAGGNAVPIDQYENPSLQPGQISLYDDILGGNDLAPAKFSGFDEDRPATRALQIAWNFGVGAESVRDYHVQVSIDGGTYQFLGQTYNGSIPYFLWNSRGDFSTNALFAGGPENGHVYQFQVVLIPFSGDKRFLTSGKLYYSVASP